MEKQIRNLGRGIVISLIIVIGLAACSQDQPGANTSPANDSPTAGVLSLPELEAVDLDGDMLQVVATTSIIGDVVGNIGGDSINLLTLIEPGQDPHSFEPAAGDLADVANAHIIFVNGWDLEEGLVDDLENVAQKAVIVPVSAGITPIIPQRADGSKESSADPHTWLDPHLVRHWVANILETLVNTDPNNADGYETWASVYLAQLEDLIGYYDQRVEEIPAERRQMVTNHDSFGYFAQAYDFEITGIVIPAASTIAEPSSNDLAQLVDQMEDVGVCTIFAETTTRSQLAETVTAELKNCPTVQVIHLYTGALGAIGSEAGSYLGMMRVNIDAIVAGLR